MHDQPHRPRRPVILGSSPERRQTLGTLADLYFSSPDRIFSPGANLVPNGPFGSVTLATTADLQALEARASEDPAQHVRLLEAYMVAHDRQPAVVPTTGLALPLGTTSPNLLVIGRSGSGKTEKVIFPSVMHALQEGWSVCILNLKGRRQTRLLQHLTQACGRGDEFRLLAPRSPDRTLAFNPLTVCTDVPTASQLAECLVNSAGARSRHEGGAWAYNQAQTFLKFGILALACHHGGPRTLIDLRRVILGGQFTAFATAHAHYPALQRFASYVAENTNGVTVSETVSEVTSFIDDVAPFVSGDEFRMESFARAGGVLVIEIEEQHVDNLRVISTVLISQLINALQSARGTDAGCLPRKTLIAIDELAATGPVPGLKTALHTCRDMGLSFVAGAQTIAQLPAIYGPDSDVVIAGFQTKIALGGGLDLPSAEAFSRWSGMGTIAVPTSLAPDDDGGGISVLGGWQFLPRQVLLPGDIGTPRNHPQLGPPATILSGDGLTPPFQAYLTPAYAHGRLAHIAEECRAAPADDDKRETPLSEKPTPADEPVRITFPPFHYRGTAGMSRDQVRRRIAQLLEAVGLERASPDARGWWNGFANRFEARPEVLHELLEFAHARGAQLGDLHAAMIIGETEEPRMLVTLVDYIKAHERIDPFLLPAAIRLPRRRSKDTRRRRRPEEDDDIPF
jgi:hypothetical protein